MDIDQCVSAGVYGDVNRKKAGRQRGLSSGGTRSSLLPTWP
jgi:hypothetical protein